MRAKRRTQAVCNRERLNRSDALASRNATARIIRAFLTEETVPNVVNICATSPARYAIVVRMLDKVGVLANTLSVLKRHGLN